MKPARFDYMAAGSLAEALATLHEHGDQARIIAGGQSLMAMLNMRLVKPQILLDISHLEELRYIRRDGKSVEVGATTTQAELEDWPDLGTALPLLAQAIPHIGHFQTRNRGTICGSICHSDPSSELPLALATLGGEVVLQSRCAKRVLKAAELQTGMLSTARKADEIVTAVRFPVALPNQRHTFREIARRHGDFAMVALAAVSDGRSARLGVGGVADKPTLLDIDSVAGADLDMLLNGFAWGLGATDDIHGSARYRRELVRRLGRQVLNEAIYAAS
jgi:2-furoyl-CoA dehydrogenase FAD binding subunit